jgi:toxin FitB
VTGWLLDTDVVSSFAPGRKERSTRFAEWLETHEDWLFLSAVTVVELEAGIGKLREAGAGRKASAYEAWLAAVIEHYAERILPLDTRIGQRAGYLTAFAHARGSYPGFADTALAATALVHGLTLLTRNLRHFRVFDIPHEDPFESLPTS